MRRRGPGWRREFTLVTVPPGCTSICDVNENRAITVSIRSFRCRRLKKPAQWGDLAIGSYVSHCD